MATVTTSRFIPLPPAILALPLPPAATKHHSLLSPLPAGIPEHMEIKLRGAENPVHGWETKQPAVGRHFFSVFTAPALS